MRKVVPLIILCLVLVSCASSNFGFQNPEYTEEEALFAVKTAARTAEENAAKTFYNNIFQEESFIPEEYRILETMKDEIPGMKRILKDFKLYYSSLILDSINTLFDFTEKNIKELRFDYPQFYVISSNTSISDYFLSLHSREIISIIKSIIKDADYSILSQAIDTFNSYINVKGISQDKLQSTDFNELYSDYIAEKYMTILRRSEELFRTTPSPYADATVKKVFGNY